MKKINVLLRNDLPRRLFLISSVILIAYMHYLIGSRYPLYIFYLIPITLSAWYETYKVITITFISSVFVWLYLDFNFGYTHTSMISIVFDTGIKLILLSIVCLLVIKVREDLVYLTEIAMTDPLTNLDNLRSLKIKYNSLRELSKENNSYAVVLIDLDNFKTVNDSFGHDEGNKILVNFSKMLKKATRNSDVIARIGGDEFIIILKNMDENSAKKYAKRLREFFNVYDFNNKFGINFSMGISIYNNLPKNTEDAIKETDILMYKAKSAGKAKTNINLVKS